MKILKHTFLPLLCAVALVGCSDDADDAERDLQICVRAVWNNGFGNRPTRAEAADDAPDNGYGNPTNGDPTNNGNGTYNPNFTTLAQYLLAESRDRIVIPFEFYPASIDIKCSDGTGFTLSKGSALCSEHADYWTYTPNETFRYKKTDSDRLTFLATAVLDPINLRPGDTPSPNAPLVDGDNLQGECSGQQISDDHLLITLHHTKALVRFGFKVDARYDKVRYVRITGINIKNAEGEAECVVVDHVLTTDGTMIAYAYIDPTQVNWLNGDTQVSCTYNIYDKDSAPDAYAATDNHLTRKAVTAKNTFKFANLKKDGVPVTAIQAGYYYDVMVTINPDYLYVLAEHDDKHMKID